MTVVPQQDIVEETSELPSLEVDVETFKELFQLQQSIDKISSSFRSQISQADQLFREKTKQVVKNRNSSLSRIPQFWAVVLQSHPIFSQFLLDEQTNDAMMSCTDIVFNDIDQDSPSFSMKFLFSENPYFENHSIEKKFMISSDGNTVTVQATPILWKKDHNIIENLIAEAGEGQERLFSIFELFDEQDIDPQFAFLLREEVYLDPLRHFEDATGLLGDGGLMGDIPRSQTSP
ncbi:putative Nucleosome assembly protein (NAP) [Blattamonas nauphoetae]|uniref:Nucleosome assembly protein (NAP) n=1 Tax=Blattamonas nauphoetae TaxID=2049346 RepID=A0ABQ9XJT6_9EUKA|nr:putative Nucleosome assembly protein (NAP) [Blattamonas nauphoetae]